MESIIQRSWMILSTIAIVLVIIVWTIVSGKPSAESPAQDRGEYFQARILTIVSEQSTGQGDERQDIQYLNAILATGDQIGSEVDVINGGVGAILPEQRVKVGDRVVLTKGSTPQGVIYTVVEPYRVRPLFIVVMAFLFLTVGFGGWRGVSAIGGLVASIAVLILFVAPRILAGDHPLVVSLVGGIAITFVSFIVAHGNTLRTRIALASTMITLGLSAFSSSLAVAGTRLTGLGSDEAMYLQAGLFGSVNVRGLLLGGIIIGVIGVLDDITTGQAAVVDEIHRANPHLPVQQLYRRGLSVGREHIASLVNTLVLAYVGASFPLLLLFTVNTSQPWWVILNSEMIAEEIVRTIVGSMALVLAVPITTSLAARIVTRPSHSIR